MARDYARKTRTRTTPAAQRRTGSRKARAGNAGAPGWAWALAGLALGLFVAFLVYLNENRPATSTPPSAAKSKTPPPGAANGEQRPRFDFYTILPEQEVVVPENTVDDERAAAAPGQEQAQYLLQAGSFRALEQADSLRARLALLGVEASVETVRLKEGDTWHRVRIGPYTSVREVAKIQERLRRQEILTLRMKIR